jgi:4-amino-4-deoxy-L-arabinose transferase-like glycosyltransferase
VAPVATSAGTASELRARASWLARRAPRPELLGLLVLAGLLNLWALGRNGWANDYYSAAVRSMGSSWHDFLFASLDPSGVMTVDKPPLSLWLQTASAQLFGYHSLSVLVPQALMGMASVALVYDMVRRRFGRFGGFLAGLALASTPIAVAVSRHNNPDALLALCCVAAVWCAVRGLEGGRTRWLVLAGALVGLGFETKMGVALVVVPGIAAAWLWIDPRGRGRLRALRQLLAGGTAMVLVGGAWPLLVELTPVADRPWVAGTSDNRILSLILDYNGLNRVGGQAGVPVGAGGNMSGGSAGPLRLLSSALGGQVGWLLGFAMVSLIGLLLASRLRRSDARSGWLIAVGGAFLVTAVLFSEAGGIFHPYYVSLLAPFLAALVGAGAAGLLGRAASARILAPLAVGAGVACELVVRARYPGQLTWLEPLLVGLGAVTVAALVLFRAARPRALAVAAAVLALLAAPTVWSMDTLGYATSGTFPSGGPSSLASGPGPGGRLRRRPAGSFGPGFAAGPAGGSGSARRLFGAGPGGPPPAGGAGLPPGAPGVAPGGRPFPRTGGRGPMGGAFGDDRTITQVLAYVRAHGGGTIAVSSQSSAAAAIISRGARVAGIGGFSGRESEVSVSWLAREVSAGKIRWVLAEQTAGARQPGIPGDKRVGARPAMRAVAKACRQATLVSVAIASAAPGSPPGSPPSPAAGSPAAGSAAAGVLYDCRGRAATLAGA